MFYQAICDKIVVTNNLDLLIGIEFGRVIGNPPYGNRVSLAIRFLNKSRNYLALLIWYYHYHLKTLSIRIQLIDMECVYEEELPVDTFPNGIRVLGKYG